MRSLRRNKGNATPSHVIAVACDTEQIDNPDRLRANGIYAIAERRKRNGQWYGHTEEWFKAGCDFWDWVRSRTRPREPVSVYGYNWPLLAQLTGLFSELDTGRLLLSLPPRTIPRGVKRVTVRSWHGLAAVGPNPFIVICVGGCGTIKIVDSRNYVDCEPKELPDWSEHDDAATILRFVKRLVDSWEDGNRGNWGETIGRLAWNNYRHEFMDQSIWVDDPRHDRSWIRLGYYGGEFQAWYRGIHEGPIYKCDVSSSYPSVMASGLFPRGIREYWPVGSVEGACEPSHPEECLATVLVHGNGETPSRREDGSICWPQELVVTTLCGAELACAVKDGRVRVWFGWMRFQLDPIFCRYVNYWWAMKSQAESMGDTVTYLLAKGMLNTLYGRFAMMRPQWVDVPTFKPPVRWGEFISPSPETGKFETWRAIAGNAQRMTRREEKDDTFPAISAFVTAEQRVYMRNVRSMLPERSVLAQQSDALLLTQGGYDALRNTIYWGPGQLGCFRLVETYDYVNIFAASRYQCEPGRCIAGVPEKAEWEFPNRYKWKEPRPVSQVVANGEINSEIPLTKRTYVLDYGRDGRRFGADGWAWI